MQGWNEEETKLIVTKFNNYIEKGDKAPPLKECRGLKIGIKTDKQIQDKVRTIIRQQKNITNFLFPYNYELSLLNKTLKLRFELSCG